MTKVVIPKMIPYGKFDILLNPLTYEMAIVELHVGVVHELYQEIFPCLPELEKELDIFITEYSSQHHVTLEPSYYRISFLQDMIWGTDNIG